MSIKIYAALTPNGMKIPIALEEMGLDYEIIPVNIMAGDQFLEDYVKINPNSKIPSLIDTDGPEGKEIVIFESGAILLYLAEKTGKLLSKDPIKRFETIQWVFFQNAGLGPMMGQFGHFYVYGGKDMEDKYPLERYAKESRRLLKVLDDRLANNEYLAGDEFSIADVTTLPWVEVVKHYNGVEKLELNSFKNLQSWTERCASRPSVARAMERMAEVFSA